ncbi:MAG: DinB family protein [Chloroflexota bacterium]
MDEKTRIIQQLDQAREKMRAVLADVDPNIDIHPPWKMKEVLAHITGWDDASIASLHAHAAGDVPDTPAERGIDHYNASTVSERESLSYKHVVSEWETTRELLKAAIRELPPDKLEAPMVFPWGSSGSIAQLMATFANHEEEHANFIRELMNEAV